MEKNRILSGDNAKFTMAQYIFVLGRDFQLSLLEIESYFMARSIKHKLKSFNSKIALLEFEKDIDSSKVISSLGGTIKIAKVLNSLEELTLPNMDKIKYSLTSFDSKNKSEVISRLKKMFKEQHTKAFFKNPCDIGLSPTDFLRYNIFSEGFELLLYKEHIALTIAIFNPKEYELRDKRPYLDRKKLTSIRLAKILINLSQAKENFTLLDPFCGSGTILQEALLLGINAVGMDTDSKSIYYARKNLTWLKNNYNFKCSFDLINKDARFASSYIEKVNCIATEPYLGPYLKRLPELRNAEKTALELANLYSSSLKEFNIILKKGSKVVFIIPKFRTKEQVPVSINFEEIAKSHGFKAYSPFTGIKIPVLYSPKGTKLDREIYILEKV